MCPARKSLSAFSALLTSEPWYVQMKHYFWACLWGCFWVRLAVQSVDSAKEMALSYAGGYHLIHGGLNRTKRRGRRIHPILLSACLLHLGSLISSFPALRLEVKPLGPWFSAFRLHLNYITHQFSFLGEKAMAPHSSTLAWRIPGMGEPGAVVYGVAQNWTQLKRLSSSSSFLGSLPCSWWMVGLLSLHNHVSQFL